MTSQSGGGLPPGVTSDGHGGLRVAGFTNFGTAGATPSEQVSHVNGRLEVQDAPGTILNFDAIVDLLQSQAIVVGGAGFPAINVNRTGDISAQDYSQPVVVITDATASAQPLAQFFKDSATQFQVDGDGVRVHGKLKTGATVAHVLGAYSGNAVPIYDESGTLLGYMPLYA